MIINIPGREHSDHDKDCWIVCNFAKLPRRGKVPPRQPLHRPILLRHSIQTGSFDSNVRRRQGDELQVPGSSDEQHHLRQGHRSSQAGISGEYQIVTCY